MKAAQLGSGGRRERGGDASREPQTEARRAVAAGSAEVTRAASRGQSSAAAAGVRSSAAAARGAPVCACAELRRRHVGSAADRARPCALRAARSAELRWRLVVRTQMSRERDPS